MTAQSLPLYLPDATMMVLQLIAQHDNTSLQAVITHAAVRRAEEIGIGALLDSRGTDPP